jgi:hypothetical protein
MMKNCGLLGRLTMGLVGFVVLVILATGCGQAGPATHPVTGTVTIDGQPASDLRVDFYPVDPANEMASGNVEAGGNYTLHSGRMGQPGAMLGRYKVVLVPAASGDDSYMRGPAAGRPQEGDHVVPKEYKSVETTPKEVEVKAGRNAIDIQI